MAIIQDVAKKVGVSRNTVSKVLNNKEGVSEKVRKQVIEAVTELGYSKYFKTSQTAESIESMLAQGKKATNVSIMVTNPEFSQYWTHIINNIAVEFQNSGFNLMYHFIYFDENGKPILPRVFNPKEILGIIAMNIYDESVIREISKYSLPIVYYDTPVHVTTEDACGDVLFFEGQQSVYKITAHILEQGIKDIGFIGDITYCRSIYDRWLGFQIAMNKYGVPINQEYCLLESKANHFYNLNEVEQLLGTMKKVPKAFICANDVIANRVIKYYGSKGIEVPKDLLVSGYDNYADSVSNDNNLTSVDANIEYLGKRLVAQLLFRIKNQASPYETVQIQTYPVFRASTAGSTEKKK